MAAVDRSVTFNKPRWDPNVAVEEDHYIADGPAQSHVASACKSKTSMLLHTVL
jgi:hypothetical protein